jgi:hypothetical protein
MVINLLENTVYEDPESNLPIPHGMCNDCVELELYEMCDDCKEQLKGSN